MKRIIFLLLFFPYFVYAQIINEDFEDGNINGWTESTSGHWAASSIEPINGSYSLHHIYDASSSSHDQISLSIPSIDITTGLTRWYFKVKYTYNPSSSNKWAFFLMADADAPYMQPDSAINGYALGVNMTSYDDTLYLYRIDNGSFTPLINTHLNWNSLNDIAGFFITRSAIGLWKVYIDINGTYDNLIQYGDPYTDATYTQALYLGVYYKYTSAQDRKLWVDDVMLFEPLNYDTDSQVLPGPDTEPSSISSMINSPDGVEVFDVQFQDAGTSDGLPTIIKSITFTQGDHNNIPNWQQVIAGAKLFGTDIPNGIVGTVLNDRIIFQADTLAMIEDGTTEHYKLYIWLKRDLSAINDNDNLEIRLNYNDILTDFNGSLFGSGDVESGDNNLAISISATQLSFFNIPASVLPGEPFSLGVKATDANGNKDLDASVSVSLSLNTGSGELNSSSGLTQNLINGEYLWNDLTYSELGEFTLLASASGLQSALSPVIVCSDYLFYLNDDFEDGEISDWIQSQSAHWMASDQEPIDGNYSLKQVYDASTYGTDIICHPLPQVDWNIDTLIWRFQVLYANNSPSSSNNWYVFLASDASYDQMNSSGNINGFVLGVNFIGNDDLIKLWHINNGSVSEVVSTNYDWNNTDASLPKGFEVLRKNTGEWEIKIDDNGGFDDLFVYGTGNDNSVFSTSYFGIVYNYSSTQDRKLTLDDIYFGEPIPDLQPPSLDTVYVLSDNHLRLIFSEDIATDAAENTSNYFVDNGIGSPISATQNVLNKRIVDLSFSTSFQENLNYLLKVSNIRDIAGNVADTLRYYFQWKNIRLEKIRLVSQQALDVKFSKLVDTITAQNISNYYIDNGIGNPISATIDANDSSWVHLVFSNPMQYEQNYILHIENVQDRYGNSIAATDYPFLFYLVRKYDVVINELMIDVNPQPVALPPYKYIELYNLTPYNIDLTGWTLQIGDNHLLEFPSVNIDSMGYVIICPQEAANDFAPFGTVAPILVSSYLTSTSGKRVVIRNDKGQIIDDITYSPDWYNDDEHDDGGWSLERIDPTNHCNQNNNWHASENYAGGTPGSRNTVMGSNPDNDSPYLIDYQIITSQDLKLNFSETVDSSQAGSILNYILNSQITPIYANVEDNTVFLHFLEPFVPGDNVLLIKNIADYCSNVMDDSLLTFFYRPIYVLDVEPKSANQLKIYFSEPVGKASAENPLNYTVDNGVGNPTVALRDANDSSIVHLFFNNSQFPQDQYCTITISSLTDIYGNPMDTKYVDFVYHIPQPFDIIINEMMIDVNPQPQGLPPQQYVELLNTSDYDIWLTDWYFIAENQKPRIFPNVKIPAGGYLLLSTQEGYSDIKQYGTTVPILGTNDLIQAGKQLLIYDNHDNLIYHLRYSDAWYHDDVKDDGGWSLEKIDPFNFCESGFNWTASEDISGGTPGRKNSVFASNPDTVGIKLLHLKVLASNRLLLIFNKNVSFTSLDTSNFYISDFSYSSQVSISDTSYKALIVVFPKQFEDTHSYTLQISNVYDDCDNFTDTSVSFVYYLIHPEYLWVLNANQLQVKFSETVDYNSAIDPNNYHVDNSIGNPNYVVRSTQDPSIVYLQFDNQFKDGETYTLSISGLKDVNGNTMRDAQLQFVYYMAKPNDIVINEILFNPYPGGSDYVELYNRSPYPINLLNIRIAKRDDNDSIVSVYKISDNNLMFPPHSYLVLTTDTANVKQTYPYNGGMFIQMKNMPAFPDDEGNVVILDKNDTIIDEFHYSEKMHFALISDPEGVALERVNYDRPTQDSSNWHSAAQSVGFGTPGLKNSQYHSDSITVIGEITIDPITFSPDNDGFDDWTTIHYKFDKPGYFANVMIFDSQGRLVRYLKKDELIEQEGEWIWDGLDNQNRKVKIGIYVVVVQIFDDQGHRALFKKPVVVAGKK